MNNLAQSGFIVIVVAIMIFLAGMIFINFLMPDVSLAYDSEHLDCLDAAISDGNKLACWGVDIVIPYFILTVLSVTGGVIASKYLL